MSRKIKYLLSIVSIVLCVTMISSIPVQALSETIANKEENTTYSSFDNVQGETEEIGNIVAEETSARTETSKKFLLDDGTTMIAEYDVPVHYQSDNGKWVEYNNSLVAENSDATADEASSEEYTNKSSNIDIKLSNKAKKNNMIKLTSDDYSISWGYDNANKSKAKIIEDNTKLSGNDKFTTLKNLTSETLYEDVFKNVDLQYFVTSTGIKENIILKSSDVQNEFNVTYKTKNLTAKQIDDYTISLCNKSDKEVYRIVAPYMTDANGNASTQLKLSIESQKGSNLSVKLTADFWFIHSIGRSFPITIDPELTYKLNSKISFQQINNNNVLSYGPYYLKNNGYVYTDINYIPNLNSGERIVNAKINFETINGESVLTKSTDSPIVIKAHSAELKSGASKFYSEDVIDYDTLTYDNSTYFSFDITKAMKDACDNNDSKISIAFEAFDTIGSNILTIQSGIKASETPSLTYTYKDFTGMESNLAYHTVDAGHNATASVSDYLGNLVINQSIYEGTGSRMPVSISATYNSINYNKLFENGSPSGYGWQFSFNQYVREVTDKNLSKAGYNYIYTDSDGTDHYLKKSDDKDEWSDEDGSGLTLTVDDNGIYINNGSVTQTYELISNGGKLLLEKDEHNNTITYTYNSLGNLTKITDGAGREFNINYAYYSGNSEPRVNNITLPDGNVIGFSYYANQFLACVKFPGEKLSWFYYTQPSPDRLLNKVEQRDCSDSNDTRGLKYGYTYNSNNQVNCVKEYGSDNTEGNYLNIQYNNDNTTTFTDRQGRSETHTFNNNGETVSVLNANGYLSSGSNELLISGGAESYTKNYITESTEQSEIKSNGYYFKSNGDRNGVVSNGGTAFIDTSEPTEENGQVQYLGTTSIKVNNPVSDSNSAFFTGAAHQFNTTDFNGKNVSFSAYVKTKDIKQIYSGGAIGAILKIKCLDSSGKTVKEVNSIGIDGTQEWQRLSVTANVPTTTAKIRVYCLIRYASGTAWFDCLQFEEGNTASDFNALQNGNFETSENWLNEENKYISVKDNSTVINGQPGILPDEPESTEGNSDNENTSNENSGDESSTEETQPATYCETVTETEPNDSITTYDEYGNAIKTEQGYITRTVKKTYEVKSTEPTNNDNVAEDGTNESKDLGNKYIYQNVKVGKAGVRFNIAGQAKADSVPLTNDNRTFGIALNIYYNNSSVPETHYQEFNSATTHQQTVSMEVIPQKDNEVINYVAFAFVYGYNENTMTAYNAMLNIAPLGNITDNSSSGDESSNKNDEYIDYEVVSESIDKSKTYMQTSTEYDSTGNYATSETDEAGNTVTYTYDTNGNKTSVTDGKGNTTNYTYNAGNNVTSIKNGSAQNQYSYNGANNISAITHNGFSYTFNYDVYNNLISTKIGDTALVTNTYSASNGNLTKTTYANGDYIQYTYDKYDNITKLTSETGVIAEFIYNKKGLVAKAVDKPSSTTTYYYYDFSGTLTGEYRQNNDGSLSYYLGYDSNGNQVEKTSINGQTKTITTGTDENENSFVSNDGVTAKTATDNFGRTTQIKTSRGEGNSVFFTDYEYAGGKSENSTTNLVSKLTQKYGADELVNYEYSYDGNGNITEIYENGTLAHKYTYDSLNQLKEEYDYINRFYINYSYDNCGNIQSKNEQYLDPTYGYPSGSPTGNVYEYTDAEWKDKVSIINGDVITYDASGNPLSYRDGINFTWENGRQLSSLQTADNSISYKYDSNGMRTQKTDNSGTTYYYYDSNKNLIGLTKGNDTLLFYYDSDNSVTSFKYNGTMYYYIKNLQGDIVKIIDQAGTEVAGYVYDAWGNIKSTTGDSNLRELNPFRYRGYVYDNESGLYYLQSRYYDPFTGRFLNADDTAFLGSTGTVLSANLFAYCENNPVNKIDKQGKAASNIVGGIIGGVIGALLGYIVADALKLTGWKKWALIGAITVAGAVLGAILGPYIAKASKKVIGIINSGLRKASKAAFKAAKSASKFKIPNKHLAKANGKYAKFNSNSTSQIRKWISEALKSNKATFHPNNKKNSYYIITNLGKKVGTKGEKCIKVVFDTSGKIWTAYPVK